MQYVPILEKSLTPLVDNYLLIIALALLAMSCEQAIYGLQRNTTGQKNLPVIEF